MYWENENSTTVHREDELKGGRTIGDTCQVSFGRKDFSGVIAATGEAATCITAYVYGAVVHLADDLSVLSIYN